MKIRIYDAGRHKDLQTGYGQMARYFYDNLKALKHDVAWFTDEEHTPDTVYLWMRPPHYVKYDEFKNNYCNVFFTMHELETFDGWKSDWPQLLNQCAGVITPSQWNRELFEKAGVTVPIEVCRLGVDPKKFYDRHRSFSVLTVHENLGGSSSRENWQETMKVFLKKFYGQPEYRITVKTWNWKQADWRNWLEHLRASFNWEPKQMPDIQIYEMKMEPQTMGQLYREHHVFVKNTKGEGWSLPVNEAYAAGCFLLLSDLPIFRERFKEGTEALFFKDEAAFNDQLENAHRDWKKRQGAVEAYSWRNATNELVKGLDTIYEKYQQQRTVAS